jgi:ABC-type nitrate/sulfonate/bicarbonate transport system permease component
MSEETLVKVLAGLSIGTVIAAVFTSVFGFFATYRDFCPRRVSFSGFAE